jgi:hypothetical protein
LTNAYVRAYARRVPDDEARDIVAELDARRQIADVLYRYCRGVDRKDFNLFRSAYHPDAIDDHGLYQGDVDGLIEWVQERHRRIVQSMHLVGNLLVDLDLDHDAAFAESYCIVTQRVSDTEDSGVATRGIQIGCRYLDRLERRDGHWAFTSHVVVYEWWRETDLSDLPLGPECQHAERSNMDPLYGPGGLGPLDKELADVRHG